MTGERWAINLIYNYDYDNDDDDDDDDVYLGKTVQSLQQYLLLKEAALEFS